MEESTMNKVELGRTGLSVTPLCIGTAPLGNMPEAFGFLVPEDQAYKTISKAFQGPFNFLDTASNYGDSERIIGRVICDNLGLPERFVLQTKVDRDSATGDFSGEQIKKSLEQSLRLLGLDHLPIVYIHDPEHTTFENIMSVGGALDVLKSYRQQGLVGHIGISGGPIGMLIKYVETGEFEAVITHNRFNLLHRAAETLLDIATKRGMAVLNAAPFASGILADPSKNRFVYQEASADIVERVIKISGICQKYGVSLKAAALQFSVRDPRITSTIVGTTAPEQIDDCLSLLNQQIPPELFQEVNQYAIYSGDPEVERFPNRAYSD